MNKKNKKKAFTLIELLIVVFIIILISSALLINYSGKQKKDKQEQSVLQFVSDLRKAQSMAMSVIACCGVEKNQACSEYRLTITSTKKYRITCDSKDQNISSEFKNSVNDFISFLPIDTGRTTPTVTGTKTFTIDNAEVIISSQGKIIYD